MESRRLHWRVTNNPSTNRSQVRAQQQNYSKKQRRRDRQGKDFQAMQEGKRSGTSSRRRAWNHRDVTRRTRPEGLRRGRNQGENRWSPGGGRGCRGDAKKIWGLSETIFRQRELQRGGIETGSAPAGSGKLRSSPRTGRPLETSG